MLVYIAVTLSLTLLALVAIIIGLNNVRSDVADLDKKVVDLRTLSLNPRTRLSVASMQSGATTPEQEGKKLARASISKRVVVGGEDDSPMKQQMSKSAKVETDG